MGCDNTAKIMEAIENFDFAGKHVSHERYGSGHINDTFLIISRDAGEEKRYISQRINHEIFKDLIPLIKNVEGVTSLLREKIIANGGDPYRGTLNLVRTKDGGTYYIDSNDSYWRIYFFIGGATYYNLVEKPEDFCQSGKTFGHFQRVLADCPAKGLPETIPSFHSAPVRFETFRQVMKEDVCGRTANVQGEIAFVMDGAGDMGTMQTMLEGGRLPLQVIHNDTRLNNIMIDDMTGEALCVIDLGTIMPGLSIFDFGGSVRFGANTTREDETNLDRVSPSLPLFDICTKGFLRGCNGSLTEVEVMILPMRAKLMTLEYGARFLTNCLQGDTYFKIRRKHHNLNRTRTQFGLMADMEKKWVEMEAIVKKYQ